MENRSSLLVFKYGIIDFEALFAFTDADGLFQFLPFFAKMLTTPFKILLIVENLKCNQRFISVNPLISLVWF